MHEFDIRPSAENFYKCHGEDEYTEAYYDRDQTKATASGARADLVMATASQAQASAAHAAPAHKWLVALAVMLGTTLEVLDTSIVNVALPHMQGSFSASVDEIAWVLTSYLVANGIMIPMTAWISSRFGRKRYFLTSLFAFVVASYATMSRHITPETVLEYRTWTAAGSGD